MTRWSCGRPCRIVPGAVLAVLLGQFVPWGGAAHASLNLTMSRYPDIYSSDIQLSYNHLSFAFVALGYADQLSIGISTTPYWIDDGVFALNASIDHSGNLLPGGTISIQGKIPTLGFTSGVLLIGDLIAFGYGVPGTPFEFLFAPTGGDALSLYASSGMPGAIVLHSRSKDYIGSFLTDFHNGKPVGGDSDTGTEAVPEPASVVTWCLLSSLAVCAQWRARRRRRSNVVSVIAS
jgi:hypothetical protein